MYGKKTASVQLHAFKLLKFILKNITLIDFWVYLQCMRYELREQGRIGIFED